ncbi:glycosyltransferase family 2 protein [Pseudobutyrivibrio xylanivorans]|uniref:Glycosyl transferase family 2 n=1 Tax=Pseudobutyrivibrio xylanivorans TaxID=185007 RepID=A0A1G5RQ69_PSEXY|nr:glycosyltransferase family 2 protein [Pseudobutyrivibrio xylanivorans]SCZ76096.1 Glycosyl transferase family 2 [Pseudobutyrivibrio xylanivorans]
MNNSLVSVVMPVYNTGELLNESIGNILNQTYTNIELLCVDDASDDALTKDILNGYAEHDDRVKLTFLDENVGAGGARNVGLKKAKGKYILFFDSDDSANYEMIEKMYILSEEHQLDMCVCAAIVVDSDTDGYIGVVIPTNIAGVTDKVFSLDELGIDGLTYWNPAPWNKLIRTEFILENKIEFQEIPSCNDVYFSTLCALNAKKIMYCENGNPLVKYRSGRKNQITENKKVTNLKVVFETLFDRVSSFSEMEKGQVLVEFVHLAESELKYAADSSEKELLYQNVCDYITQHYVKAIAESNKYKIVQSFINNPNSYNWLKDENECNVTLEHIQKKVSKGETIIIWGYGKNGTDLDRLLYEDGNEYEVLIADNKNIMVGGKTKYGSIIISTSEALSGGRYIAATNREIREFLEDQGRVAQERIIKGYK